MSVIAIRNKFIAKLGIVPSVLLLILIPVLWSGLSLGTKIAYPILDGIFLITFGYLLLLPKNAIILEGDILTLRFLFHSKRIPRRNLKCVSYHENGKWETRKGFWSSLYTIKHDIRNLTVTYTENDFLKHKDVLSVEECKATALIIEDLIKNQKN